MALYLGKDLVSASSGSGGVTIKNQDKTFTENGSYAADSGYTGLGVVKVDVQPKNQDKTFTENGTYAHDSGYTGLGEVVVAVPPTPPNNQDITVKENGTYTAESGYSGLGTVTVEVPTGDVIVDADYTELIERIKTEIIIPEGVTTIGEFAFYQYANLRSITIPKSVTTIGNNAFYRCYDLEEIYYNAHAVVDGKNYTYPFYEAGKSSSGITVFISKDVTRLPKELFKKAYLNSVEFEDGSLIQEFGEYVFSDCANLNSITIPNDIAISSYLFFNSSSLKNATFLGNVSSIGYMAFSNCSMLEFIDFTSCSSVPTIQFNSFSNFPSTCQIRVPASLYDEWIAATNWSNIASQIVAV